jgi:endonuclease/exonuclease/phosphatase family metal-dependent hydrolase/uncharacterized Zn-binding protein involved in type VI secretion
LATDIRFVTYNALNFDTDSGNRQDEMEVVFEELDADIIAIQEIVDADGADILLDALNANGQQYARSPFMDGPDTDRLLFFRTSKVNLISSNYISTSLRPIGEYVVSVDNTLVNIYNLHLKASQGQSNENQRLTDATTLRSHLETLPSDREFIVAGDFNIYTNSEPAYQKVTQSESNNNGRSEDLLPANQIGNWHSNSSFASVHTQSPRNTSFGGGAGGGLDDRFDMIFTNFGLNDGLGLEYVAGSQFVPGNDGQHFNTSILNGTNNSASQAVLQALHDASDHLPVVADFEVSSPIGVSLNESDGSTTVSEDGGTDSYELVLDSVPDSNVSILVTPDNQLDIGNGVGASLTLTFTPGNALTPQTVNVSTIDDADDEGLHFGTINHSVTSSDSDYDGLSVDPIQVTILDNDSTASSSVLLNEIFANVPGTDTNEEFIEILADPLSTLTDVWLLEVEGDGAGAGVIDRAQDLSAISAGSNGLLLLGDGYSSSNPWGSEVSSDTTLFNLEGARIENGSITVMLVEGFTGTIGDDIDSNNDGSIDSAPWAAVLDDVGWTDGGSSDRVYASAFLSQSGTPDAATRIFGNNLASSVNSWFNGDISGTVDYSQGSSNLPSNAVITPGNYNFGATAPSLDSIEINAGQAQRSTVDGLQITFEGLVDLEPDAFTVIQRSDSDGNATGTNVTVVSTSIDVSGNTVSTIAFDSLTRNNAGALIDGNYELTIDGSKVARRGTDLTLGSDVVYGNSADDNFFAFYGDDTGNGTVDVFDLLAFRQTYRAEAGDSNFDANLDFNADASIDIFDLLPFRSNYRETITFG